MGRGFGLFAVCFTLGFTVIACDQNKGPKGPRGGGKGMGPPPEPKTQLAGSQIPVQTRPIIRRAVQNRYRASTVVEALRDVELKLTDAQSVAEVNYAAGDEVKKDTVIARLSSPEAGLKLRAVKVEHANASRLFKASKSLYDRKLIAKDKFLEAQLQLDKARINLEEAQETVRRLTVRAPFDGVIAHNDLQTGAHPSTYSQKAPIRMVSDTSLKGTFAIPVLHREKVEKGMTIRLLSRGVSREAQISRIAPVVDRNTGTVLVYFEVENSDRQFIAGERASLDVPLGASTEKLVLPPNSVVFEGDTPYVFTTRSPTGEEVDADIARVERKGGPKGMGPGGPGGPGSGGGPGGGEKNNASKSDTQSNPRNADSENDDGDALASKSDEEKQKELERKKKSEELRQFAATIPRARKIPVAIEQLATGEYALKSEQPDAAKELQEGASVIVIGLYQLADAAKLKVVESL